MGKWAFAALASTAKSTEADVMLSPLFVWRDEASNDDGKTWKLQAEYQMKRRHAN